MTTRDLAIVLNDLAKAIEEEAGDVRASAQLARRAGAVLPGLETQAATLAAVARAIRKVVGE